MMYYISKIVLRLEVQCFYGLLGYVYTQKVSDSRLHDVASS